MALGSSLDSGLAATSLALLRQLIVSHHAWTQMEHDSSAFEICPLPISACVLGAQLEY